MESKNSHQFRVEIQGDPQIWERMNVYLHLYTLDDTGAQLSMLVADNLSQRENPFLALDSAPHGTQIVVCMYAIPLSFPGSRVVADSPPFELTLKIVQDGQEVHCQTRPINQWGGDQLIGLHFPPKAVRS